MGKEVESGADGVADHRGAVVVGISGLAAPVEGERGVFRGGQFEAGQGVVIDSERDDAAGLGHFVRSLGSGFLRSGVGIRWFVLQKGFGVKRL